MPPDRNLPGELLQGALWCHLSVQVLGVSCRAWDGTGTKGNNAPGQEVEYTLKTALVF